MAIAGKSGSVYVDATGGTPAEAGDIKSWSIDATVDTSDTTCFTDNGWRTFVATLKGWTGSVTASWDYADANQKDFWDNFGSKVDLKMYLDEANTKYFSGTAIVTGVHPSVAVDGVAEVTFDLQGDGSLTYATS